jgi:hypothetical protein
MGQTYTETFQIAKASMRGVVAVTRRAADPAAACLMGAGKTDFLRCSILFAPQPELLPDAMILFTFRKNFARS